MKHAVFDATGFPTAFYSEDVNPVIPPGTVEITDEQWQELLQFAGLRKWDGTQVVVFTPVPVPPIPVPLTANERLDAGVMAALTAAEDVRDSIHAIPANFNAANFQQFLLQAKILSDAFVAMLQAQAAPMVPPAPPPP
jgi:hypothetical protein